MGPYLSLGERRPCKAEAPGSNPGGSILIFINFIWIFISCSWYSRRIFGEGIYNESIADFMIIRVYVTLLALTN